MWDNMSAAKWAAETSGASPQARRVKQPGHKPVIDEAVYSSMAGSLGDHSVVESVVRMFLDAVPPAVAAMREVSLENREAARSAAHELKGNAGMMGATALADVCTRFEIAAREGPFSDLAALAEEVAEASDAVQTRLRARLTGER